MDLLSSETYPYIYEIILEYVDLSDLFSIRFIPKGFNQLVKQFKLTDLIFYHHTKSEDVLFSLNMVIKYKHFLELLKLACLKSSILNFQYLEFFGNFIHLFK